MEPEKTAPSKGKKFLKIALGTVAVLGATIAILSIIQVDVPAGGNPTSSVVIEPRETPPRPITDAEKLLIETRVPQASSTQHNILTRKQMIVMETRSTTTNIRASLTEAEKATLEKRISQ